MFLWFYNIKLTAVTQQSESTHTQMFELHTDRHQTDAEREKNDRHALLEKMTSKSDFYRIREKMTSVSVRLTQWWCRLSARPGLVIPLLIYLMGIWIVTLFSTQCSTELSTLRLLHPFYEEFTCRLLSKCSGFLPHTNNTFIGLTNNSSFPRGFFFSLHALLPSLFTTVLAFYLPSFLFSL